MAATDTRPADRPADPPETPAQERAREVARECYRLLRRRMTWDEKVQRRLDALARENQWLEAADG